MAAAPGARVELLLQQLRDVPEVDRRMLDPHPAGVEPREVEQVGGELRQPRHLLAHRLQELLARLLVEILVRHQLQKPAEREERRAQLVRRVRDELAPGALEVLEPAAASARTRPRARRARLARDRRPARRSARRRCARRRARAAGSGARAARRRHSRQPARRRARSGPRPAVAAATRCTLDSGSTSESLSRTTTSSAGRREPRPRRTCGPAARPCRACVTPLAAARRATCVALDVSAKTTCSSPRRSRAAAESNRSRWKITTRAFTTDAATSA